MKIDKKTAKLLAKQYFIDLKKIPIDEWINGLNIEMEHKDITEGDLNKTARIVIAHLLEMPDYYKRLMKMEEEGNKFWKGKDKTIFIGKKRKDKQKEGGALSDIITKPIETITNAFSPINKYNNTATETLNLYGNVPIANLVIAKTPLNKLLEVGINAISLNKFNELKQKYGYDELYHLSLIANLTGGSKIIIEKNEVVTIEKLQNSKSIKNNTMYFKLPYSKGLTINNMLNNAHKLMGNDFWNYDAFNNNCQTFILKILEANNLLTPPAKAFIYQDVKSIHDDLNKSGFSYVPKIMKKITDMGSIVSRLIGKGNDDKALKDFNLYLQKNNIKSKDFKSINKHFIKFINNEGIKFL